MVTEEANMPLDLIDIIFLFVGLPFSYHFFESYSFGAFLFVAQLLFRKNDFIWRLIGGATEFGKAQPEKRRQMLAITAKSVVPASKHIKPSVVVENIVNRPSVAVLRPPAGHVLVIGASNSGKSHTLKYLVANYPNVIIVDPHAAPGSWPANCKVYGGGRNYELIGEIMQSVYEEMRSRYAKRNNGETRFEPLILATDEMTSIVRHVENASQIMTDIAQEGRKVGVSFISASHSDTVEALKIKGNGTIRENFTRIYLPPAQRGDTSERIARVVFGNEEVKRRVPAGVPKVKNSFPERVPDEILLPERVPDEKNLPEDEKNLSEEEIIKILNANGYPKDRIAKLIGGRKETTLEKITEVLS